MTPVRRFILMTAVVVLVLLVLLTNEAKPARAACSLGDIICEMQQAIQQLIDSYVDPLKEWATFQANKAFYAAIYEAEKNIVIAMWNLSKALSTVAVGIGVLSNWISDNFFQPMISNSTQTFQPVVSIVFAVALLVLGISYMVAMFVRLNVVAPRNMFMWYIAAALFFQIGPSFYTNMSQFRQTAFTFFYASSLDAVQNESPFDQLANGDDSKGSAIYGMPTPCDNFPTFLSSSAGTINGLDIALAYQKADGFDIVNGGSKCLGGGTQQLLPRMWLIQNGYFDANISPQSWVMGASLDNALNNMKTAVVQGFSGISRLFNATPLVWFSIGEQLVSLCLMVAQGLTFISFAVALLFSFFKRTEAIAWAVLDQWIALIVQTVVIAVIQAMVVALYISASYTGSPLITLAVSVAGSVFMGILLFSGIKAIWNAFNRLFEAFGQATGGVIVTPGTAAQTATSMAVSTAGLALTGGAAVVGAGLTGAAALNAVNNGATVAQAAGLAFGDNNAFTNAAATLYRLPGLRGSALSDGAEQFMEGARLRGLANGLPGGDMLSPMIGAQFLTDRNPDAADGTKTPMLKPGIEAAMSTFISNPRWKKQSADDTSEDESDPNEARLQANKQWGTFTPKRLVKRIGDRDDDIQDDAQGSAAASGVPARVGIPAAESDLDEQMKKDMKDVVTGTPQVATSQAAQTADTRLNDAATRLGESAAQVGKSLGDAGQELQRAGRQAEVQQRMKMYEGTLNTSGPTNVAGVMGDLVALFQQQKADAGPRGSVPTVSNFAVANGMAEVMNLTPVGDSKPPVRQDLARFQMYADQAVKMGLDGNMAEQAVLDTKQHGEILPQTRANIATQIGSTNAQWRPERVDREIQTLQTRAAMLPDEITAVGIMPVHETPPILNDTSPAPVTPAQPVRDIQVPAASTAYAQGKRRIPYPRRPAVNTPIRDLREEDLYDDLDESGG